MSECVGTPWTNRVTNREELNYEKPETLEAKIIRLFYFGHVMRANSLEKATSSQSIQLLTADVLAEYANQVTKYFPKVICLLCILALIRMEVYILS